MNRKLEVLKYSNSAPDIQDDLCQVEQLLEQIRVNLASVLKLAAEPALLKQQIHLCQNSLLHLEHQLRKLHELKAASLIDEQISAQDLANRAERLHDYEQLIKAQQQTVHTKSTSIMKLTSQKERVRPTCTQAQKEQIMKEADAARTTKNKKEFLMQVSLYRQFNNILDQQKATLTHRLEEVEEYSQKTNSDVDFAMNYVSKRENYNKFISGEIRLDYPQNKYTPVQEEENCVNTGIDYSELMKDLRIVTGNKGSMESKVSAQIQMNKALLKKLGEEKELTEIMKKEYERLVESYQVTSQKKQECAPTHNKTQTMRTMQTLFTRNKSKRRTTLFYEASIDGSSRQIIGSSGYFPDATKTTLLLKQCDEIVSTTSL